MSHKYQLGQNVRLRQLGFSNGQPSPDGLYEITRLMPPDRASEVSYRLRSAAGERVAVESELESDTADAVQGV